VVVAVLCRHAMCFPSRVILCALIDTLLLCKQSTKNPSGFFGHARRFVLWYFLRTYPNTIFSRNATQTPPPHPSRIHSPPGKTQVHSPQSNRPLVAMGACSPLDVCGCCRYCGVCPDTACEVQRCPGAAQEASRNVRQNHPGRKFQERGGTFAPSLAGTWW
jgi:hypothetical protein